MTGCRSNYCRHVSLFTAEFSVPFEIPSAKPSDTSGPVSEDGVSMLVAMGFTRDQAVKALKQTVSEHVTMVTTNLYCKCPLRTGTLREQGIGCSATWMSWMLWKRKVPRGVSLNIQMVGEVSETEHHFCQSLCYKFIYVCGNKSSQVWGLNTQVTEFLIEIGAAGCGSKTNAAAFSLALAGLREKAPPACPSKFVNCEWVL